MTLMSILLGAGDRKTIQLTASGNNYDVYTNRSPSYVAGKSDIFVTVPGTVGSASTGTYAMLVPNAFSSADTVTIVNNGVIQGAGGNGGARGASTPGKSSGSIAGSPGAVGGNALYVNRPVTIVNNGTLAGGGGGGGGGSTYRSVGPKGTSFATGGGGGGGAGTIGGAGGSPNGGAGTSTTGGAGGSPNGGAGGGRGAAGTASSGSGGAAGKYIVGNPFVTWSVTGTLQGGVG